MTSKKEEPNTSTLFGNATDDDPFSQLSAEKTNANQETSQSHGDVSSLFGNTSAGNADLFFSSTNATASTTPQSMNPPMTAAPVASFFDQPQPQAGGTFFDNLGHGNASNLQQDQQVPTTATVDSYSNLDYSQQQQQDDQSQWIQFDPNVHYYYDEQGYVHYYDPNTNQEYDMSQYGYDQQGQTYDYQYDPQYAEYYAQQGHDPNAYQQEQSYAQDGYDPNAYQQQDQQNYNQYAHDPNAYVSTQTSAVQQDFFDQTVYSTQDSQHYNTATNTGEVPAQIQAEETVDTQNFLSSQQEDAYGAQQNYAPADADIDFTQQTQTLNYEAHQPSKDASDDFLSSQYAQIQNQFETEDLQQSPFESSPAPFEHAFSLPPQNITSPPHSNLMSPGNDSVIESDTQHQEISKPEYLDELNDLVLGTQSSPENVEQKSLPSVETKSYEPQTNGYDQPQQTSEQGLLNETSGYQNLQYGGYEPYSVDSTESVNATTGYSEIITSPSNVQQFVTSSPSVSARNITSPPPPPRANSITSVSSIPPSPRANSIQSGSPVPPPPRVNSIGSVSSNAPPHASSAKSVSSPPQSTFIQQMASPYNEDRSQQNKSPFGGYYPGTIERSATVPPPMTERIASPRPQLVPCPDPQCEGENKPKAKFCCECGLPLAGISRSTTPAANLSSVHMEPFNPMAASFGAVAQQMQRNVLDDIREAMRSAVSQFMPSSVVVHEDRQLALDYIQRRLPLFEDQSKALLWNIVKAMLENTESVLGDGGSLDKAIVQLILATEQKPSMTRLDDLEELLLNGDREKACEFASSYDMWGHSFVIATGNSDLFKLTMSKFIQRELYSTELVPQVAGNNKALRLLYSAFNGAGAEAVTEFMKQTVNDDGASLDEWKRALALVLANRSSDDQRVIHELGSQLKKSGSQPNDSQLCYLLSPEVSGSDIVSGDNIYTDLDGLFLCEMYEYASKTSLPQDFKLVLAWWLTELGFTEESKKYCDSIANAVQNSSLEELKKLGDIPPTISNDTTSLLSKQSFDLLISSIEEKSSSQATQSGYGGYGYGYGYDNSFSVATEAPKTEAPPFSQPRGIQSPFQAAAGNVVKPVSSPFGVSSQPPNAVSSPFGQSYTAQESSGSGWWDSNAATTNEHQEPSYEPNTTYEPPVEAVTTPAYAQDDDDDLGFGNTKTRKSTGLSENTPASEGTESRVEEKTKEVENKSEPENKEKPSGGWGIFSLFGRNKEASIDEKKPVKANLGEQSSFYYDEKEKRWVNKLNDSKPAAATPPPPPKSLTPQPPAVATPPPSALKPNSMPPPRTSSAPVVGQPPSGTPPLFNTPPMGSRKGAGGKKPMRSRYVDVFNQS